MLSVRAATAVGVWVVGGAIGTGLFLYASPALEAQFAPVLVEQTIHADNSDRTPGRMCWTWHWTKNRYAQPIAVSWQIAVDGTGVEFPAITERKRDGEILRNPQASQLGKGQNDLCVKIPSELDRVEGLTIKGQINYRMPHGLWTIWQDLPIIRIPPLA